MSISDISDKFMDGGGLEEFLKSGHNRKDLFSATRENNADLITFLKCLGLKDERVLNNPGLNVLLDRICYAISVYPNCMIRFDEEKRRVSFSSSDGRDKFNAGLVVTDYGLSFSYGTCLKKSVGEYQPYDGYNDSCVDCLYSSSEDCLKFIEQGQYQTIDFLKREKSYYSSYTTRYFDECGVEYRREEQHSEGAINQGGTEKLGFINGHPYKKVYIRRVHFDTADVTELDARGNITSKAMVVLNNEHGLQKMQLPGYIPQTIEPLSDEEIAKKIQHMNSPIVQESLKRYVVGRDTYCHINDFEEIEKGKSR